MRQGRQGQRAAGHGHANHMKHERKQGNFGAAIPRHAGGKKGWRGQGKTEAGGSRHAGQEKMGRNQDKFEGIDLHKIARKAMDKYGFASDFPSQVMRDVDALAPRANVREGRDVRDMRHLLWSSIDNYDTEDLDQIECCEPGAAGEIIVRVGIADVDVYVPKGSAADMHARKNTTSVYTGIETFPMLPDRLSKNLSSLPQGQDRLAIVSEFTVLPNGVVRPGGICRALVRNKAKLVYEQVAEWLEGTGSMPAGIAAVEGMEEQIWLQDKAAQRLGKYRMGQGALELESLEARAVIKDDKVLGLAVVQENRAMHIIENFMIAANGVMSGFLEKRNIPSIHRVVRVPKDWAGIKLLAKSKGFALPSMPSAKALSVFLAAQKAAEPEKFADLSLAVVKMIGAGEYVLHDKERPIGHFCLAVTHYTHGTAPNRRYVDLIIQRLIKTALAGVRSPYGRNELSEAAGWCTDREMSAKRVERFMVKAEAATLLAGKVGETFDAIITGASEKGVYARLLSPPVEGKVGGNAQGARVGQRVRVTLVNLDPRNGFIDYVLA
jgi:ribonuclease R